MAWTLPGPRQPSLTAHSVPFTAGRPGPGSTLVVERILAHRKQIRGDGGDIGEELFFVRLRTPADCIEPCQTDAAGAVPDSWGVCASWSASK